MTLEAQRFRALHQSSPAAASLSISTWFIVNLTNERALPYISSLSAQCAYETNNDRWPFRNNVGSLACIKIVFADSALYIVQQIFLPLHLWNQPSSGLGPSGICACDETPLRLRLEPHARLSTQTPHSVARDIHVSLPLPNRQLTYLGNLISASMIVA